MDSTQDLEMLLTGLCDDHVVVCGGSRLHRDVVEPLRRLQRRGRKAGLDIRVASGFRSFEHQLRIWNAKATGQRPVSDDNGRPIDMTRMDDTKRVFAILRWSALPGTSRHHWGTDLDIWDGAAVPAGYQLQLYQAEYDAGGPFHPLSLWLQREIESGETNFYLPYTGSTTAEIGGIAREPWHLSYRPLADHYSRAISEDLVRRALNGVEMALKEAVMNNLDEIFRQFIIHDKIRCRE